MRIILSTPFLLALVGAQKDTTYQTASDTDTSDVSSFIYGGEPAAVGEFPYFVDYPGCGGSLIAPDVALSAAHCGDVTGSSLFIGAYRPDSTAFGAQRRTCVQWIEHPYYLGGNGLINDWALCKLDSPVTIDESQVKLELNAEDTDDFPILGVELVAMGFGLTGDGINSTPLELLKTTLEGRDCFRGQPENQICAGGADGEDGVTDVCRGDSGGPLVKIVPGADGAPDIHKHVGLVSSGALCPTATTGTYARTSVGFDWIQEGLCELNSVSATNCDATPPPAPTCTGTDSTLVVNVQTDEYPSENRWVLEEEIDGRFVIVIGNPLELGGFPYSDTVCLKPETTYRWTLSDDVGDGLCTTFFFFTTCSGSYSVDLNGVEIVDDGRKKFKREESITFVTPADPDAIDCNLDESGTVPVINPNNGATVSKPCAAYKKFIERSDADTQLLVCNADLADGSGVLADKCRATCAELGVGPCAPSSDSPVSAP